MRNRVVLGSTGLTLLCAVACGGGTSAAVTTHDAGTTYPEAAVEAAALHDTGSAPDTGIHAPPDAAVKDAPTAADVMSDSKTQPDSKGGGDKYGSDGPVAYAMMALTATNGSSSFTENAYIPSSSGTHPLVSFSPGLQQQAGSYTSYVTRLASWGFVVLIRDDPGVGTATTTVSDDLTFVLTTWLSGQTTMSSSPLFAKVDMTHIGLAGHSRGGQATLLAIEGGLAGKIESWFGIDPVDTGITAGPMAGPTLSTIGIPTGFLGAQVSTSCSPADANYQVLFGEAPSPSVSVTAVNASHTQFEDQSDCVLCTLCTPLGTADDSVVLAYSLRYITAFFARELLGDASVGAAFQGAGGPSDVAAGLTQITSK